VYFLENFKCKAIVQRSWNPPIVLLNHSMVQSPSWEANWFTASQEIPRILWNPKVHTTLTSVRHLYLSWASPIQSTYPHLTSWRSILILSTYLLLGLRSGLFPSGSFIVLSYSIVSLYMAAPGFS